MTTSWLSALEPEDFERQVNTLPPPGRAFSGEPDTLQVPVIGSLADAFATHHASVMNALDVELDTALTDALLPEWEADYGLPDPCTVSTPTMAQRRSALIAKRASSPGGQSIAYFTAVAAALGYTITITEFQTLRLGASVFGSTIAWPSWAFAWQVNVPPGGIAATAVTTAEFECRISKLAPAHTTVLFAYT